MNNVKKIIEYGLYVLVFLLPIQTRWIIKVGELNDGYWEYGTISLYMTDIVLVALLLLFIINKSKRQVESSRLPKPGTGGQVKLKVESYWWIIAVLELFIFISIFFAPDKILAIYGYMRFLLGIGLFWLIVDASYKKIKLIISFLIGIAIQGVIGIWQFLSQSSFSSKWLGMAIHRANELGVSVIETIGGERWLRAYGGLDHPNILGGLLAVGIILLIGLMIKNNYKLQIKKLIFYYILLILYVAALFFSFSRGAWLAAIISILIMLLLSILKGKLAIKKKILKVILVSGITVFILFNLYNDLVKTRIAGNTRLEVKSNTERIESYGDANKLIKNNWFLGVGIGNYTLALSEEAKLPIGSLASVDNYFQPVHNTFLLVWAEIGIFGLLSFVVLLGYVAYLKLAGSKSPQPPLLKGAKGDYYLPILAAVVTMMMFDHWWWSLHFGIFFFWVLIGLILREKDV